MYKILKYEYATGKTVKVAEYDTEIVAHMKCDEKNDRENPIAEGFVYIVQKEIK